MLLREIQSDRLEGEFSVYRQSTGANCFMTKGDVISACKHRLTRFAASYLQSIEVQPEPKQHTCIGTAIDLDDAASIEKCASEVTLTISEVSSAAYVAGWLERKCYGDVAFSDEEPLEAGEVQDFIQAVSRGALTTPHACTFELVRRGLCFIKSARHRACCRKRLMEILKTVAQFGEIYIDCPKLFRHLANVPSQWHPQPRKRSVEEHVPSPNVRKESSYGQLIAALWSAFDVFRPVCYVTCFNTYIITFFLLLPCVLSKNRLVLHNRKCYLTKCTMASASGG